jgi:hypothetical protein
MTEGLLSPDRNDPAAALQAIEFHITIEILSDNRGHEKANNQS